MKKIYDAVVTVKHRISSVCIQDDLDAGLSFEQMVRDLIESDGLPGVSDEIEIIHIEKTERNQ